MRLMPKGLQTSPEHSRVTGSPPPTARNPADALPEPPFPTRFTRFKFRRSVMPLVTEATQATP